MVRRNDNTVMMRACTGAPGMLLAVVLWAVMSVSGIPDGAPAITESGGTLLPAPGAWGLHPALSCMLGMSLAGGCAIALWLLNKTYNFLPGPGAIFSAIFLIACGATPDLSATFSPGLTVAAVVLWSTYILFGLYGRRRATSQCLLLFSLLSWGSMAQQACLMLAPVFLAGLVLMRVGRPREFMASLLGLVTPYWIVLGLGIASPEDLGMSVPRMIAYMEGEPSRLVWTLISAGITALFFVMLVLYNSLHSLSAGVRMRACLSFVNLLGGGCIALMLFDCSDFTACCATLYMCLGLVVTRTFEVSRSPRAWVLPACIAATYVIIYFLHD